MSDGRKSCLGFAFLIFGLLAAVALLTVGGMDALLKAIGGDGLRHFQKSTLGSNPGGRYAGSVDRYTAARRGPLGACVGSKATTRL